MKKLLVMMFVVVMSIVMLTGCGSDVEDAGSGETSEIVSEENIENSEAEVSGVVETDTEENETLDVSEENSEIVEEITMYSADEVMAHIDTLIAEYQYNDPEHIKALVIAANLDYIAEEDLNTILATYGYTMDNLSILYEECLMDACISHVDTNTYYYGINNSVSVSQEYGNRITLSAVMLNETDKVIASEVDTNLIGSAHNDADCTTEVINFFNTIPNNTAEKVMNAFAYTVYTGESSKYNPYNDYLNSNE